MSSGYYIFTKSFLPETNHAIVKADPVQPTDAALALKKLCHSTKKTPMDAAKPSVNILTKKEPTSTIHAHPPSVGRVGKTLGSGMFLFICGYKLSFEFKDTPVNPE